LRRKLALSKRPIFKFNLWRKILSSYRIKSILLWSKSKSLSRAVSTGRVALNLSSSTSLKKSNARTVRFKTSQIKTNYKRMKFLRFSTTWTAYLVTSKDLRRSGYL
jgi:hypothetical protein